MIESKTSMIMFFSFFLVKPCYPVCFPISKVAPASPCHHPAPLIHFELLTPGEFHFKFLLSVYSLKLSCSKSIALCLPLVPSSLRNESFSWHDDL